MAVAKVCEEKFAGVTVSRRPWNRWSPEESVWWLVPSADYPAYPFPKFFCGVSQDDVDLLECGLYVEKGLDPVVDPRVLSWFPESWAPSMMNDQWAWHRVTAEDAATRLEPALLQLQRHREAWVRVEVSSVVAEQEDPRNWPRGTIEYSVHRGQELTVRDEKDPERYVKSLGRILTVSDLISELRVFREQPENASRWVDVLFFARWRRPEKGEEADLAEQLWAEDLVFFADWLRESSVQ